MWAMPRHVGWATKGKPRRASCGVGFYNSQGSSAMQKPQTFNLKETNPNRTKVNLQTSNFRRIRPFKAGPAGRRLQNCIAATRQPKQSSGQPETKEQSKPEQQSFLVSGAVQVGNLVNTLLFGAASRIERGTSVCVTCRGTGTVQCKECKASGITNASSKKSMGGSLQSLMGTRSKEKEWIVSNRCRNCRGHGRLECPKCNGLGKRFVDSSFDWD